MLDENASGPLSSGLLPVSPCRLRLEVRRTAGATELVLVGELDLATSRHVQAALEEIDRDPPLRLVIDLRRLSFMDSSGVHLLVTENNRARARGASRLAIRRGPYAVQRVLQLVGLEDRLPFLDD